MSLEKLQVFMFTDPADIWSWNSAPVLKQLEAFYGENIQIIPVMAGMVKNILKEFPLSLTEKNPTAEKINQALRQQYEKTRDRHAMPVNYDDFNLYSDEYPSSQPLNVAFKAGQLQDPNRAKILFRKIQEAIFILGLPANRPEILEGLVRASGLDLLQYQKDLKNGLAEQAFQHDLDLVDQYDIKQIPSYIVIYKGKGVKLPGFQTFETIHQQIEGLTKGQVEGAFPEASDEAILNFIDSYQRVTPLEIAAAFNIGLHEADLKIIELQMQDKIIEEENQYGRLLSLKSI